MPPPLLPPETFDSRARHVAARLRAAGYQAFFAGGCVRDALLGRPPQDIDIATDAHPDQVGQLFPHSKFVGKSFGVTLVVVEGQHYEVATFRRDIGSSDGRHPDRVAFANPEADAQRRDFTINGLFYDPANAEVIDYVGGWPDLQARKIRAIGDPASRFREDHLRLLRAVRFASVLSFSLERNTAAAIRQEAELIRHVSAERILQELTRIWTESPSPGRGLHLLHAVGLLAVVLPEIEAMVGVQQPPQHHPEGDVFVHTALAMDQLVHPDAALAWSVLLHDVGKPPTYREEFTAEGIRIRFDRHAAVGADMSEAILRRLKASNELRESVVHAVRHHMRFVDWPRMKMSTRRRFVAHALFPLELDLHRADCLASHGMLDTYAAAREEYERFRQTPNLPEPWINGHDLMALGVPEGPEIGRWRRIAFDAQLEGRYPDRDALIQWLAGAIKERAHQPSAGNAASPIQPPPTPSPD